ncbi:hypothetical protein H9I32_09715 [Bacillus sp. Xin]|uniref:hypothetical protein n=1 Tax=unclassified Bacillus (in: firmicutes) TaxID=185979 RepID=UPI00157422FA|nr:MULTISPECIES: hypothetical protein [unclassified Bacillus (in: firmicutes)]MBC6972660.1 hypothetical protein [Bacillus sp. Xin]NSW39128.1 hypothetical protein [Bacillus sp. Xin1]
MSDIQSQLKLTRMKLELLNALAKVEAQESAHPQRDMFRTVDLAANVASPNICAEGTCPFTCTSTCPRTVGDEQARNASPDLLSAMKDELKDALAKVEAQESTHPQRNMFRTVDLAANIASPNNRDEGCTFTCGGGTCGVSFAEQVAGNASPALLDTLKDELKNVLAKVEAREQTHPQRDMFRAVDLAANIASPNICAEGTCPFTCTSTCPRTVGDEQARNASPDLLSAMKDELKSALAKVEAQESVLRKDDKA